MSPLRLARLLSSRALPLDLKQSVVVMAPGSSGEADLCFSSWPEARRLDPQAGLLDLRSTHGVRVLMPGELLEASGTPRMKDVRVRGERGGDRLGSCAQALIEAGFHVVRIGSSGFVQSAPALAGASARMPPPAGTEASAGSGAQAVAMREAARSAFSDEELRQLLHLLAARGVKGLMAYQLSVLSRRLSRFLREADLDLAGLIAAIPGSEAMVQALVQRLSMSVAEEQSRSGSGALEVATSLIPGFTDEVEAGAPPRIWIAGAVAVEKVLAFAAQVATVLHERGLGLEELKIFATAPGSGDGVSQWARRFDGAWVSDLAESDQRYFRRGPSGALEVDVELRRAVVFAAHDPEVDPHYPRISLGVVPPRLGLFAPSARHALLGRIAFAMREGGTLVLATPRLEVEAHGFEVLRASGVYRRVVDSQVAPATPAPIVDTPGALDDGTRVADLVDQLAESEARIVALEGRGREFEAQLVMERAGSRELEDVLDQSGIGMLVLDQDLILRSFTEGVRGILPLRDTDLQRPIQDLRIALGASSLHEIASRVQESRESESHLVSISERDVMVRFRVRPRSEGEIGIAVTLIGMNGGEKRQPSAGQDRMLRHLVDNMRGVFWVRNSGTLEFDYVSPASSRVWGRLGQELMAEPHEIKHCIHADDLARYESWIARIGDGELSSIEYRVVSPGGGVRWIHDRVFPRLAGDEGVLICGLAQDVSGRKGAETRLKSAAEALEQQANRDPLTGCFNRRGLERGLGRELERLRRSGALMSAILVDCDDFKSINDKLGHATGDVALRLVTGQLAGGLRPTDLLGRIGGDEFLILLPETREAEAWRIAERLRLSLAEDPIRVGREMLRVTASLGVSAVSPGVISLDEIIAQTQHALSLSKRGGKNQVSSGREASEREPRLDAEREAAVLAMTTGIGISVYHQEIVRIEDEVTVGQEFLIRGPEGPYRSPPDLFRLAMERNALTRLDLRCARKCLSASRKLESGGLMNINLLPSTLIGLDYSRLEGLFDALPSRHHYCIEISEQQFIGDPQYLREAVSALKRLDVLVAIDDVGFGRSSLESLVVLEPDIIKIDRGFVHGASVDDSKQRSLSRLLAVAGNLCDQVIVEGVEEREDFELVREFGVPLAQGWLWGKPTPV